MPTIDYYNTKGKKISGVTTLLENLGWNKRGLMHWSWTEGIEGRDYKATKQIAADAGTLAHYLIECDIKGVKPVRVRKSAIKEKAENAFQNFLEWKGNVHFEIYVTEPHLISEEWQYGGTPDCIARINGKLALFDWKTGDKVYEDMLPQIAAYGVLWHENHPDEPLTGGSHLLRLDKTNASFNHHWWQDLSPGWNVFYFLMQLHKERKVLKKLIG